MAASWLIGGSGERPLAAVLVALRQHGPGLPRVDRGFAGVFAGGEQVLGQDLGEQPVVALAVRGRGGLVDQPWAARPARCLAAPDGIPGVNQ